MIPIWVILLIILIAIILYLLWKIVQVPSISVATDKSLYDRTEIVSILGKLIDQNSTPMSGKTVSGAIVPPAGDAYVLPNAVTDELGEYEMVWEIPDDAPGGAYTVQVASLGASASGTFTQSKLRMRLEV